MAGRDDAHVLAVLRLADGRDSNHSGRPRGVLWYFPAPSCRVTRILLERMVWRLHSTQPDIRAYDAGVGQVVGATVMGRISDKHGRKIVLLLSFLGSAIGFLPPAIPFHTTRGGL